MRAEYWRDFGRMGGKHAAQYIKGTNLVLFDDNAAKAFPTSKAVNDALLGLLTPIAGSRPAKTARKSS